MDGIQRLANMIEGQKDKYLIVIVKYLMLQTEMNEAFLKKEKNLKDMADFIRNKAKKQATNGVAVIEDKIVFKWAKEYFIKSNKELGIKEAKIHKAIDDISKVEVEDDEFGSIFDCCNNSSNLKKEKIEQISLFQE